MYKELLHSRLFNFILLLLFAFLFFGGLSIARALLVPLSFAALLAMLLLPLVRKLEKRLSTGLATGLSIFLMLLFVAGVIFVLSSQIAGFSKDLPLIRDNMTDKINNFQDFIHDKTGVAPERQMNIVKDRVSGLVQIGGAYVQKILVGTTGAVATFGIILIYVFFFVYYRNRFANFVLKITPEGTESKTSNVMGQISHVTQNYLTGVLTVIVILAVLNTTGLLIVGVKHAIFFGVLAAMLNIIPYIGSVLGGLLPTLYVFLTLDSLGMVIATACVFIVSQFLENNFLTPMIVGSKVKVNPLATLIALLIGGALWGVAGMILFIPFLGIVKIIFDNVQTLEPYGYLIGEDDSDEPSFFARLKQRIFKKS